MGLRAPWMTRVAVAALAVTLGATASPAYAGAWTKRQYEGLFITGLGLHWLEATVDTGPPNRFKREAFLYFEFGLTDRITMLGRGAYQEMRDLTGLQASSDDLSREPVRSAGVRTGFGGLELGARLGLFDIGRWTSSLQVTAGIPGSGENWINEGFGVGGGDVDTRLQVGRSVSDRAFVEFGLGLRARGGEAANELRLDATAGCGFVRGADLMLQSYSVWALAAAPGQPAYSGHRLQASLLAPLGDRHALQLSALTTLAQDEMSRETAVMASIWTRF